MVATRILIKPKKETPPLHVRFGTTLLLLSFIAMMAGRFTLDRLSPSLPDLDLRLVMVYVLGMGTVLWLVGAREYLPKPAKFVGSGLFVAWVGWLAFSSVWAPPGARIGSTLRDAILLAVFTLLAWAIMRRLPSAAVDRIWKWTIVAALLYFVLAMAAGPGVQGRYAAPGGGPNVFVRVMVLGAIAALYYASTKKKVWPLLPVPLFAVGAALSGSRGGLVSALIVLFLFAIPITKRLGFGKMLMLCAGFAGGGWLLLTQSGQIGQFIQDRYIQQTIVEGYSSGRDTITEDALRLYAANPGIGTGLDGYFVLQDTPGQFEYPHNLIIATMAETGTVGAALLLLCFFTLMANAWKSRPVPSSALYAFAAGGYLGVASLFSGDYYDTRLMWFFLGFAVVQAVKAKQDTAADPAALPSRKKTILVPRLRA